MIIFPINFCKLMAYFTDPSAAETVVMKRSDSIAKGYFNTGNPIYLKVDMQGYEDNVLDCASGLPYKIKAVQLEVSLVCFTKHSFFLWIW